MGIVQAFAKYSEWENFSVTKPGSASLTLCKGSLEYIEK
jgi:hypothetical protein